MTEEPLKKMQEMEEAVREAQQLSPPEAVVFVPPKPVWQPFRLPEEAPPPRVQWQPTKRPEYKWNESEHG